MANSELTVPGMSCDACRSAIDGALSDLPGVTAVKVDLERKLVSIEHDEHQASIDQLVDAVTEQGYEVTGRKTPR